MAGKTPFFITGANAFLRLNHFTLAMCTDVTYSIRVKHASPHILGVFESFSQEPLSYEVSGSFTVVRYTKGLKNFLSGVQSQSDLARFLGRNRVSGGVGNAAIFGNAQGEVKGGSPDGIDNKGNGVGSWGPSQGIDSIASSLGSNSFGGTAKVDQSFDPSKLHVPQGFDIEIVQKSVNNEVGVIARLRGCRLTGSDFKLVKRGVALQTFTFQASYADEDSFSAGSSGEGQVLV